MQIVPSRIADNGVASLSVSLGRTVEIDNVAPNVAAISARWPVSPIVAEGRMTFKHTCERNPFCESGPVCYNLDDGE